VAQPDPIDEHEDAPRPADEASDRADWLVGADEGLEAEMQRRAAEAGSPRPVPKLFKPGAGDAIEFESSAPTTHGPPPSLSRPASDVESNAPAPPARKVFGRVNDDSSAGDVQPGLTPMMTWDAGANSVPSLHRERPARAAALPATARDFPMDDAEERRQQTEERRAEIAAAAEHLQRGHTVVQPQAFEIAAPKVAWWMQAVHVIQSDRRVQIALAVVVMAVSVYAAWPRGGGFASVAELKRDAARYDGRDVMVRGKVGEVFPVGGGYAYNLHQGKDTLVVFTRVRTPRSRETVTVSGSISTGFLDGQARLALFESLTPPK